VRRYGNELKGLQTSAVDPEKYGLLFLPNLRFGPDVKIQAVFSLLILGSSNILWRLWVGLAQPGGGLCTRPNNIIILGSQKVFSVVLQSLNHLLAMSSVI
jgi:hypothetical protein